MSYADETSIRAALGKYGPGWTASSTPSVDDGLARAEEASGEIDAILAARGITTPLTSPASFVARLRDLASLYAAARVAAGLFPQAAGPASTTYHEFLMRQYRAGLDGLRAGEIPAEVGTTTHGGPRSFWTSNPIDPDTGEAWEPVFGRRTRW